MSKAPPMASEVDILKSKAANKKGAGSDSVETTWPKVEFGASTEIDNVTKETKTRAEYIVPAGSMFSLGAALPNSPMAFWYRYTPEWSQYSLYKPLSRLVVRLASPCAPSYMSQAQPAPSEVNILKQNAANSKGAGGSNVEIVWPKPKFDGNTALKDTGTGFGEYVVPPGSMFTLGAAMPNHTVLKWGAYFPPGTMFPDGVLVPIHARMVSVQPF
ncbi:hypothetical protein I350_08306 [Cryptococcus amylolentus CBS 6273]|uniref:Uncharacterized protein n=1 Tax=Cryptococcus amylolentus CBS 6273 TaxID=1296118 RepID=A0A1E3J600_9TREE|nr:hypothetical protein I350_08306 [Cryptococcus amylolentus CBS 6273]